MEDTLKRLLEAEQQAETIVQEGKTRRDEISRRAVEDANEAERHFSARIPEIHAAFLGKARKRAEQTIAELELRYEERKRELRKMAEDHQQEAVETALQLITSRIRG